MKKKLTILFTTLVALVLEILPYGAVLNFANPEGESWRRTFSYFDLTPFGYANFSPFIVALLTCSLLVLTIVSMLTQKTLRKPIIAVSVIAAVLSFAPLLMGIKYYSVVGALISATLAIIAVISFIKSKKQ
ncbi:MAG: hypothetical protein IJZ83_11120 [Clostridia bacterium]|nr:hypothetical protein [Clostridia bacterium]MBQ8819118.1 hypothetical protein [Clostridia bacterium]